MSATGLSRTPAVAAWAQDLDATFYFLPDAGRDLGYTSRVVLSEPFEDAASA